MKPLLGKLVLVTRPAKQASGLTEPLEALGAQIIRLPVIEVSPIQDSTAFDEALRSLCDYDWVVFTSVNGVQQTLARLDSLGLDLTTLRSRRLAVIGKATGVALAESVRSADLCPPSFVSESLAEAFGEVAGNRILLLRAEQARMSLPTLLREKGAEVSDVTAYRLAPPERLPQLPEETPDYITFTSSSSVFGTHAALVSLRKEAWLRHACLACIGPVTSDTVIQLGYPVGAVAKEHTIPGLIEAVVSKELQVA